MVPPALPIVICRSVVLVPPVYESVAVVLALPIKIGVVETVAPKELLFPPKSNSAALKMPLLMLV